REITRKIDEQINSVRRELANLLSIGIISSNNEDNNRLYYEVNQKYEHYPALSSIFGGKKQTKKTKATSGPEIKEAELPDELKALGNVDLVLYTGQFTRDERSGVDFLVVGDLNQTKLDKFVSDLETKEGKEIRYTSMNPDEFEYRRQVNDRFLSEVLASKKQVLVDKNNWLK
ncbi:hypothetical protein A3D14_01340, partial [Candidatus Saccharibacteria bacterium RIFCSPHIGHO2_02_FULL_47_12]